MTTEPTTGTTAGAAMVERVSLSPVGSRRVGETIARLMSVFGVLFSLESIPGMLADRAVLGSALGVLQVLLVYGAVGFAGVAGLLQQRTRGAFLVAASAYLVALALWPFVPGGPAAPGSSPWLLQLTGVACGFVVVAARCWQAAVAYVLVVAVVVAVVRTTPAGGGAAPVRALLTGAFDVVVAFALLAIVVSLRQAATAVDRAQSMALGRYADAQIDEATEAERTRTDALVHDSVLTTFLSAAGAGSGDARGLAARMARHTMDVLSRATVASSTGPKVAVHDLLERVRSEAGAFGEGFTFGVRDVRDHSVPDAVADAVVSAAVQAMTNSVKHAGGSDVPRSVQVQGTAGGGVRVVVEDRGSGFDPALIASERLGVRVSIFERMHRVGGEVDLSTAVGRGTVFVLSWPAAAHAPHARTGDGAMVGA